MNQAAREIREGGSYDVVVRDDLRPAGNGKDCFFCGSPLGGLHKQDCVIRKCAGQYMVAIRDNESGEVRHYRNDMAWDGEWVWTDGNYSCDCNRHLFFNRAVGIEPGDEHPCGDTRYTVIYVELPTGERIPIDLDDRASHSARPER
jgi:hypothetical protein